ncbi:SDR family NAD(P)-dependent oxidoreductase [Chloroflexota bacterium]
MGDRLKDKVAVITGAGRGIGRAIALLMYEEGAKAVVNDLGTERDGTGNDHGPADEVVAEIKAKGGEAIANYDSVATVEGGQNIIKSAVDKFGKIDILVNNANSTSGESLFDMTPEHWDAVTKVHLYGAFNCTKPAAIFMRQQRFGRIISMSSRAALIGYPGGGSPSYGAAKAGVAGFTRVCARGLGKYGITVNAITPNAATRSRVKPAGTRELPEPEDVAPIVVFLATDAAANINGCIFDSFGGEISLYCDPTPIKTIHKDGRWTIDELLDIIPTTLAIGLVNPAPPNQE